MALATLGCASSYMPVNSPRVQVVQTSGGLAFLRDGRLYEHGFFGGGLADAVADVPEAVEHAETYQGLQVGGFLLSLGGGAAMGIGLGQAVSDPDHINRTQLDILIFGGAAVAIVGGLLHSASPPHLWDAINIHNDEMERRSAELAKVNRAAALPAPAVTVPLPVAPVSKARRVPFDGGVAHIELDASGKEHVELLDSSGRTLAESYCDAPEQSYDAVRAFFTDLRSAIDAGDVARAATFMSFPLRVNGAEARSIASREQFMSEHPSILTDDLVARVRAADPGQVFCNDDGTMLGSGILWARVQTDNHLAVWVINLGSGAP